MTNFSTISDQELKDLITERDRYKKGLEEIKKRCEMRGYRRIAKSIILMIAQRALDRS